MRDPAALRAYVDRDWGAAARDDELFWIVEARTHAPAVMPKGVEHGDMGGANWSGPVYVIRAVMPKGVEHGIALGIGGTRIMR